MWDLGNCLIAGTGDFNGDGFDDVLLRATNGSITAWLGQQGGGFLSSGYTVNPGSGLTVVGTGDFNGDGRDDVLMRTSIGQTTAWLGQANGGFVSSGRTLSLGPGWSVGATGDFNGDGRDDLFMQSTYGQHADWLGQADGGFVNSGATIPIRGNRTDSSDHWFVMGGGDFNGDGRSDVLWKNSNTGVLEVWQGNANGSYTTGIAGPSNDDPSAAIRTGDFNGDGRDDILRISNSGAVSYWQGSSSGWGSKIDLVPDKGAGWHVAGIGDFDSDGHADFLWANSTNFDTQLNVTYVPPPSPEELWAAALADVSEFFDAITNQASTYSSGADQNSYYDDHSNHAPFEPIFMEMWGFLPSVQSDPAAHYWDFLTQDIDPEFQEFVLNSLTGAGFSGTFGNNFGSMTHEADGTTTFDMNGMLMRGTWHPFETSQDPLPPDAIVITGNNVGYWTFEQIGFCGFDPSAGYSPPNNGGGSSATPNATPCVETTFATPNASLADANREALEASDEIAAKNDWDAYEYSSIVYVSNGVVGHTDVQTQHLADRVNWLGNLSQVPDGAVILGIVHSHPDLSGITDTIPSGGSEGGNDWIMYRTIVNFNSDRDTAHDLPRGITVDPNMLLWIRSPEDPNKTYVYDNTDKSQDTPGCSL